MIMNDTWPEIEKSWSHFLLQFAILSTDDLGRDLPGAEALIRRHDDVERALTVIENKMEMLESEALRLVRSQPHMARTVQTKQTEIIENWERLNDKFDERFVLRLLKVYLKKEFRNFLKVDKNLIKSKQIKFQKKRFFFYFSNVGKVTRAWVVRQIWLGDAHSPWRVTWPLSYSLSTSIRHFFVLHVLSKWCKCLSWGSGWEVYYTRRGILTLYSLFSRARRSRLNTALSC